MQGTGKISDKCFKKVNCLKKISVGEKPKTGPAAKNGPAKMAQSNFGPANFFLILAGPKMAAAGPAKWAFSQH